MSAMAACLRREVAANRGAWLGTVLAGVVGFQMFQLVLLILRFGNFPNYLTVHDWPANVLRIIRSTPSVADMIPIILDEWFIEIGSMNYSFGRGIAEWSFVLMPAKLAVGLAIAILFATDLVLLGIPKITTALFLGVLTAFFLGILAMVFASLGLIRANRMTATNRKPTILGHLLGLVAAILALVLFAFSLWNS